MYEPSITKILNLTEDQGGLEVFVLMETKIHKGKNKYYKITFDYGPSEDPNYNIYIKNGGEEEIFIASINAEKLIIPGNGYIYSCGRSNELYNKKRKYKLSDNSLIEVAQASYYIGLKTQTNAFLTLYSEKNKQNKVAVLPKNYNIEVLLEKDDWIMIKTSFGLTGWVKLSDLTTYDMSKENLSIKNFYFSGD